MTLFRRRRLIAWLIRAYIKRWGKSFLLFFGIGLVFFFLIFLNRDFIASKIPFSQSRDIGIVGSFRTDNLPSEVLDNISEGLTNVSEDGVVHPSAAKKWEIKDGGKTYIFHLNQNLHFSDGKQVDSYSIRYSFSDVKIERPDKWTLVFKLKESYSPFLLTVSNRKIFKDNLVGIGKGKITDIKVNGGYVQRIDVTLSSKHISYKFFDTQEALRTAFLLGEIDVITDINSIDFRNNSFKKFNNATIEKKVNYSKLVTIFYDNQNKTLSDKKIRKALSYALPNDFREGQRNFTPYSPKLWANTPIDNPNQQDIEHSRLLLDQVASTSGKLDFTIKTLPQYRDLAQHISESWKAVGVNTVIETVDSVPQSFQIFLGEFLVLRDPDQYSLWHSGQPSNISNYRNLRIDKLLEDGRKTISESERKAIYANFEKYLLDDSPASFLYFPYTYTVSRR